MKIDLVKFDITKIDFTKLNINQVRNIKVISLAFLIVIFILDLFLVLPLTKKIKQANLQQKQNVEEASLASKMLFKDNQLGRKFFSLENIDDLFDKISDIAQKNRIRVKINNNLGGDKKDKNETPYVRKILSMEALGTFKNLGDFLAAIYDTPVAILDIDDIRISRYAADPTMVQAHISFSLLAQKDEKN